MNDPAKNIKKRRPHKTPLFACLRSEKTDPVRPPPSVKEHHMPESVIHLAEKRDIPDLLRPDIFKPSTPEKPLVKYTAPELEAMLESEKHPVYVRETDGKIEGYAFCELKRLADDNIFTPILTMYIDDICVDETARGKHAGTALYEHVRSEARRIGCHNITLRVWEFNDPAVSFYTRMGMKTQARIMEEVL